MQKPSVYITEHQHSKVIGRAFANGIDAKVYPSSPPILHPGPAAMYGILRGTGEIIKKCQAENRDWWYIDHGYFGRGHYEGYYRVTPNALQETDPKPRPPDRWEKLNRRMKPWKKGGTSVVVLPLTWNMANFLGIDPRKWLESVKMMISSHTDRPIEIKWKNQGELMPFLREKDAWCIVTHSSNGALDAVCTGIPAIATGGSALEPISWRWEDIESPIWPDREEWAHDLSYCQFTLSEMRSGEAWEILSE